MGAQTVLGLQEHVIATAKHFIVNEQETNRNPSFFGLGNASISATVDDKTMHELYLWPFQDLVKAGVGSVMCSYNRVNGSHGCQNSYTQNYLLKSELAFQGYVISDNGALHTGIAAANAGMDVVTPFEEIWGENLTIAISNGTLEAGRLNDMVTRYGIEFNIGPSLTFTSRIVAPWIKYANFEPGPGLAAAGSEKQQVISAISPLSRKNIFQGAAEGIVLVKNDNKTLPLKKPKILALFGYDAHESPKNIPEGPNTKYTLGYQSVNVTDEEMQGLFIGIGDMPGAARLGTLLSGGGSPSVVPAYVTTPFAAFSQRAREDGTFLVWDFESQDPVYPKYGSDACIVFINEFAAEGQDRSTLADSWSDELVENVASKCPNVSAGLLSVLSDCNKSNPHADYCIYPQCGHSPG
jgi:beta-glucosidase